MPKLRVYQLARELNRDNSEIIRELQHMGVPVTSHSNTVEDRLADQLRKKLGVLEIAEPVVEVAAPQEAPPEKTIELAPVEPVMVEAPSIKPAPIEVPVVEQKPEPRPEPKAPEKPPVSEPIFAATPV